MPDHKGKGLWPAIWMLGDSIRSVGWPQCGEIDILEYVSYQPDVVHCAIHCKARNHRQGTEVSQQSRLESAEEEFHIYGVEWREDGLKFYINSPDNVTMTYERPEEYDNDNWPWDKPHHFLLNVAVGGTWGGRQGVEDDKIFPATMEVDYVRVYRPTSEPAQSPGP